MIVIGADHGGFKLKNKIIDYFKEIKIDYLDVTNYQINMEDDYPDIALKISEKVINNNIKGIAICGSGIGICIACNKIKGIRAGNCFDKYTTSMARKDNDINILCLGERNEFSEDFKNIIDIIEVFLKEDFLGGRHLRRVDKIHKLEGIL